jgi:lipopolysaccharide transport system ATP-binding protein
MSDVVISVENLSKQYRLGSLGGRTFRQDFARWWARKRGKPDPYLRIGQTDYSNQEGDTIWALRDINLQVRQGEIVGIIGRNGAGKSTLLKILSRITAPTAGEVKIKGRIGSLLEVGTGFHPELTGRENIYLNGAILGMTRAEVDRKFDEIVDFSGVEQYIDTPVKRYSSGMHVRLAFAVAAHLEPEILIVDEVLAVGDVAFQKKCLGKMKDVSYHGRTVLLVSHNMTSIETLCTRGILVEHGNLILNGAAAEAVSTYLKDNTSSEAQNANRLPLESDCGTVLVTDADIEVVDSDVLLNVRINALEIVPLIGLGFEIRTDHDIVVASQGGVHSGAYAENIFGAHALSLRLKNIVSHLNGGDYRISIWLARPAGHKYVELRDFTRISLPVDGQKSGSLPLSLEKNGPLKVLSHFAVCEVGEG